MLDLIVFDLAGTTVYDGDAVNVTFRAALAAFGVTADPAVVAGVMGLPKPEAVRILLDRFGTPAGVPPTPANVDAVHVAFTRRMSDYYATDPAVREVPGAVAAFLAFRRAGVKVALNTGFFRPIVDVLLARLGWAVPETVDAVVTSDEVPRGRPHPDMVRHLMARLGVADPARVAKVGDTLADLEEGTNAGCRWVIGVTTGSTSADELRTGPHTHLVTSVADVPALLLAGGGPG